MLFLPQLNRQQVRASAGLALVALLLTIRPAGCAETAAKPGLVIDPGCPGSVQGEVRISPDDLLKVSIFDVPQISGQYRVSPGGFVTLPLVSSPVRAAGRTPGELSRAIVVTLRAEGLVSQPRVTVQVEASRLHSVVIGGAVNKPQIYPVFGHLKLLDALAQAGGLSKDAGDIAIITRGQTVARCESGGQKAATQFNALEPRSPDTEPAAQVRVNLKQLMEDGASRLNINLYPGDRVIVQRAGVIYVLGAVNRPGGFPLTSDHEHMTVLRALALAEDLRSTAVRSRAVIIRRDTAKLQQRREITMNLNGIFAGHVPDPPLQAGDIIFVPDSTSQKVLRRGAEAAVQLATGVIIWRR